MQEHLFCYVSIPSREDLRGNTFLEIVPWHAVTRTIFDVVLVKCVCSKPKRTVAQLQSSYSTLYDQSCVHWLSFKVPFFHETNTFCKEN